jgi:hypothetical protein
VGLPKFQKPGPFYRCFYCSFPEKVIKLLVGKTGERQSEGVLVSVVWVNSCVKRKKPLIPHSFYYRAKT